MGLKKRLVNLKSILGYIFFVEVPSDKEHKRAGRAPVVLVSVGAGILYFIVSVLLTATVGFLLGITVSKYHIIVAGVLAAVGFYIHVKKINPDTKFLRFVNIFLVVMIIMISSLMIGGQYYDLSYDGQSYHQETIIALSRGWNPVYEKLDMGSHPDISFQNLLNSYPKASEVIESVIYKGLGSIESAKGLNFIMFFMAFAFVLGFLLRLKSVNPFSAILGTALLVFNPVFIVQSFSFYLDGQVYMALISLAALLGTFLLYHKNHLVILIMMSVAVLWNFKLVSMFVSGIFILSFMVMSWYREKVLVFFKILVAFGITAAISILVIGFNPYITNIKWFGNPFYPALGKGATDYIPGNMPATLVEKNRLERLIYSVASRSEMKRGPDTTHTLKLPFTYDRKEAEAFSITNNTLGGFGPLFSGAGVMVLLIVAGILLLRVKTDKYKPENRIFLYTIAVFFASSAIFPISSYARFVPQLWAIAPIAMIYAFSINNIGIKILGAGLAIILIWNVALVGNRYFSFVAEMSGRLKSELAQLQAMSQEDKLIVSFGDFRSNRVRFAEAGIDFTEERNLPCENKKRILIKPIPESIIQIC